MEYEQFLFEELDEIYIGDTLFFKGNDITNNFYWYAHCGDVSDSKIVLTRDEMHDKIADLVVIESKNNIPVLGL